MRKAITTVLMGALIVGALLSPAAEAGKRVKKRKATGTYSTGAIGTGDTGGFCLNGEVPSCVRFSTKPTEKFVKLTIKDASGTSVAASVSHPDQDGDGFSEPIADICGKSKKLAITPGAEVIVFPWTGPSTGALEALGGSPQCTGVATTGTVTAIFTNR